MNRFAQILAGKVIYIYETDFSFAELSLIFSPTTVWVDVTNCECEIGYVAEFRDGVGLVVVPSKGKKEHTLDELKELKLGEVDAWTASKITGGFISSVSGEPVRYDSDKDTQITMQGIALNVNTELFAKKYPNGCPIRGYVGGESVKSVLMLSAEQVLQWCADLSIHIGNCKQEGWAKQAEVNACTTKEELDNIKWGGENSV